jgi:hypothetical protein
MSDQMEDATDMKPMSEETELRNDVRTSMKQIDEWQALSNRDAKAELRKRLDK